MPQAWPPLSTDPWLDNVSWDTIYINGVPWGTDTPVGGKITVKGAARHYKLDQKDAKGQDGSTVTYLGIRPKTFRLVFQMWTSGQFAYWNEKVYPFFFYTGLAASGQLFCIPIAHPAMALCNITQIITESIGQPEVDEQTKMLTQVIEVREFFPAQVGNASKTPTGPNPAAGPPKIGYVPSPKVQVLAAEDLGLSAVAGQGKKGWFPTSP